MYVKKFNPNLEGVFDMDSPQEETPQTEFDKLKEVLKVQLEYMHRIKQQLTNSDLILEKLSKSLTEIESPTLVFNHDPEKMKTSAIIKMQMLAANAKGSLSDVELYLGNIENSCSDSIINLTED